ncbi:hypothetical protein BWD42_11310 [Sphingobacterium sp. CZ-UAM]|nr:hypothetical protein BWD42_11310 [Sphingobacterium sp. CZ-UAM]
MNNIYFKNNKSLLVDVNFINSFLKASPNQDSISLYQMKAILQIMNGIGWCYLLNYTEVFIFKI